MRLVALSGLLVPLALVGCGGSNSSGGKGGAGGQGGSTGVRFDDMCTPTLPNDSLNEGFFSPRCPSGCLTGDEPGCAFCTLREDRESSLVVTGDISESCGNVTATTWDPDLGIVTIREKLLGKPESECGLVVQFGATSEFVSEAKGCGALPNSAQYTQADDADGPVVNAKSYQLTNGILAVRHISDHAIALSASLFLERVSILPDEVEENIEVFGPIVACARTPRREDGGICPSLIQAEFLQLGPGGVHR